MSKRQTSMKPTPHRSRHVSRMFHNSIRSGFSMGAVINILTLASRLTNTPRWDVRAFATRGRESYLLLLAAQAQLRRVAFT